MKINQHNYETYLLDYIEGRLDPHTIAELESFLATHPELKKPYYTFQNIYLIYLFSILYKLPLNGKIFTSF